MLVWALRLLKMVLVLPETAGSLVGMSVIGKKKKCSCQNLGGLKKIMQIKSNMQVKILILVQLQCHTWL